ncbi:MAG: hypothetical protein Q8N47_09630 [Bryobacterales bacterium]|nr:hypothetical protein [Bryobacterales bacterium]
MSAALHQASTANLPAGPGGYRAPAPLYENIQCVSSWRRCHKLRGLSIPRIMPQQVGNGARVAMHYPGQIARSTFEIRH